MLKEGDCIELKVSVPNWFDLREAGIQIWCVDDLTMGDTMEWVVDEKRVGFEIHANEYWSVSRSASEASGENR